MHVWVDSNLYRTKTATTRSSSTATANNSPARPVYDANQIVMAIVKEFTAVPESEVTLKLEINAEVPSGLDRVKIRTLTEISNTLGFIVKSIG